MSAEGLVDPIVPIDRAVEGIERIDEHPETSIKLCVSYDHWACRQSHPERNENER